MNFEDIRVGQIIILDVTDSKSLPVVTKVIASGRYQIISIRESQVAKTYDLLYDTQVTVIEINEHGEQFDRSYCYSANFFLTYGALAYE